MDDGDYIVFVELARDNTTVDNIMQLIEELQNLTEQQLGDWRVRYFKSREEKPFSREALESMIPLTADAYNRKYMTEPMDQLKAAAGVKVSTKAPKNAHTESLRNLAGIIR